jgi:DNA-binding CsgD family transcriptional regulator
MESYSFKRLFKFFSDYSFFAQKAIGDPSTIEAKKNLDLRKFLQGFHSFDVFCYALIDISELEILKFSGSTYQLTGYEDNYFEGKSYYKFLKLHSIKVIIRSLSGSSDYFNYLYAQKKEKRAFIKANRTLDLIKKNGEKIHVLVQSVPVLFNSKMEVIVMLVICTDISSIKPDRSFTHYIIDSSDKDQIKKIVINQNHRDIPSTDEPSPAEKKVLDFLAEGLSSKQIAERLYLSEHTVKNHRKNMLKKFDCGSSSSLVRKAILNGWI